MKRITVGHYPACFTCFPAPTPLTRFFIYLQVLEKPVNHLNQVLEQIKPLRRWIVALDCIDVWPFHCILYQAFWLFFIGEYRHVNDVGLQSCSPPPFLQHKYGNLQRFQTTYCSCYTHWPESCSFPPELSSWLNFSPAPLGSSLPTITDPVI